MARAFIFSLDAFVAFSISLIAIYALIFFSATPSAYYTTLSQAHYLAKDTLTSLALTKCTEKPCGPGDSDISLLDFIAFRSPQPSDISAILNEMIPEQFGYRIEVGNGETWEVVYDTANDPDPANKHAKDVKKLSVTSYGIAFQFEQSTKTTVYGSNPYGYMSCDGKGIPCDIPTAMYETPGASVKIVKLTVYI